MASPRFYGAAAASSVLALLLLALISAFCSNSSSPLHFSWFERDLYSTRDNGRSPDEIMSLVDESMKFRSNTRELYQTYGAQLNPIDNCRQQYNPWNKNRKKLAHCAIGFGKKAIGGYEGKFYRVTDSSDNDAVTPVPGTLRHAVIQEEPLWIVFSTSMTITLKQELIMNSYKTIDGRGSKITITGGGCLTLQNISNVIIHGISINHCHPSGNTEVRSSTTHFGWRTLSDGDAISIFSSHDIWIDHCTLSHCRDGLIDAVMASTDITISNNYFFDHNEVMLMGHSDSYMPDKDMRVTIAYNHFGEGLIQRMPRCRHGMFSVYNNLYSHWKMYAIGGSASPTIVSQGNKFVAPNDSRAKEVTKRQDENKDQWKGWDWVSRNDAFENGAYFTQSGEKSDGAIFSRASSMMVKPFYAGLTENAGALECDRGYYC